RGISKTIDGDDLPHASHGVLFYTSWRIRRFVRNREGEQGVLALPKHAPTPISKNKARAWDQSWGFLRSRGGEQVGIAQQACASAVFRKVESHAPRSALQRVNVNRDPTDGQIE